MSSATSQRLPLTLKLFNGSGSIAFGIKDNGFSVFLLTYYNLVLGMEAWLVSLALVIALVVDAFVDPFLGNLSDRTFTKWGRRLPWLYSAPIPLAIAWYFLWAPPVDGVPSFWTLLGLAILVRLLLSACEVPSIAVVPEITQDYEERTNVFRFRFFFGWTSGLLTLFLTYTVFFQGDPQSPNSVAGYQAYGLFGAIVMAFFVLFSAAGQHRWIAKPPIDRPPPFTLRSAFAEIIEAFSEKAFLIFAGGALAAYVSQGMTFALSNYLLLFVWELTPGQIQIYPLVLFFSVLGSLLSLGILHRRYGKALTGAAATLVAMVFWLTPYAFKLADVWPELGSSTSAALLFAFVFVSNGAGVSAVISATSMLAEIVEQFEDKSGRRAEGSFYSGNWLVQKSATGVGILFAGAMLSLVAFPTDQAPGTVAAPIIDNLIYVYGATIMLLAFISAYWLARFPITREDHEARLAARAEGNASEV